MTSDKLPDLEKLLKAIGKENLPKTGHGKKSCYSENIPFEPLPGTSYYGEDTPFEPLPGTGVGKTFHSIGKAGYGSYGVRVLVPSGFDPSVLERFQEGGVNVHLAQSNGMSYVEVAREGYRASEDFSVVKQVNGIAASIEKML